MLCGLGENCITEEMYIIPTINLIEQIVMFEGSNASGNAVGMVVVQSLTLVS